MTNIPRTPRHPAATPAWRMLKQHHKKIADVSMRDLFAADPERAARFSLDCASLHVDYSKHRITDETLSLLLALATEMNLPRAIEQLFAGACVNTTEQRPALHTALRTPPAAMPGSADLSAQVQTELARMDAFIAQLHDGKVRGSSGRKIETLVNIGIGGSDLGPRLVTEALRPWHRSTLAVHFAANADPVEISTVLAQCVPETTLFIISSKSFTTQETLANARLARDWLHHGGCRDPAVHFAAVTANSDGAQQWGIAPERTFRIREWVGGRYSVWSAIGLPAAATIGMDNFRAFLAGAHAMDQHFRREPLARNIPVILALLDIWYINFFRCETLAVIPYTHALRMLPRYLSQLMMESNGKSVRRDKGVARYQTGAIIWGDEGTNIQHACMQLLHQGTRLVPVDFIAGIRDDTGHAEQHRLLLANCLAQSEALMRGNTADLAADIPAWKIIPGNRPSTTMLYEKLAPATLGMLLALYEHRTYVQACLWNINAFDQWGVELGKTLASSINDELRAAKSSAGHDPSTRALINRCLDKS